MPFKPGHKKIGGRPKGVQNKFKQTMREKAEAMGIDPREILLKFAAGDWNGLGYDSKTKINGMGIEEPIISPELREKAAEAATKYIDPQLKAIEHNDISPPKEVSVYVSNWNGEQKEE